MSITIANMKEATFGDMLNNYAPDELKTPLFTNLRVFVDGNDNFWFIGSEVASIMGYKNPWKAIIDHVPEQYKRKIEPNNRPNESLGRLNGNEYIVLINEQALYALAMRSNLPQAYQFQDWVYRVISRIRQYGGYINPNLKVVATYIPDNLKPFFDNMFERNMQQQQIINEMKPKVDFYDRAMDSSNMVPMTVIAKDFGMSANELHTLLSKLKVIYRVMDTWVLHKPYQNRGLTSTKSSITLTDQFGKEYEDVEIATYWTERGRMLIYGIMAANGYFPLSER